jgi:hypothetical protein
MKGKNSEEQKDNAAAARVWRNRIVGEGEKPASEFIAHELNWRTHSKTQKSALSGLLTEVGWVQRVVVSHRTGKTLDGHARVEEALALGADTPVPYVEVDLTHEEERKILRFLDPIGALAGSDAEKLDELTSLLDVENEALLELIANSGDDSDALDELAAANGGNEAENLTDPNFTYQSQYGVIVECEDEAHQQIVFNRLSSEGLKVKVVVV